MELHFMERIKTYNKIIVNMKNKHFIYSLVFILLTIGLYSCDNEDYTENNSNGKNIEYINTAEKARVLAQMTDTTVYEIRAEDNFGDLTKKFKSKEEELLSQGYTKLERLDLENLDLLKAAPSVKKYTVEAVWSIGEPEHVKCVFSSKFCDEFNSKVDGEELRISSKKRYICEWRPIGTFYNLKTGERASAMASPKAGYLPSKRDGFTEREYEAYLSPNATQFQMRSFLIRIKWEDVNHTTIMISQNFPFGPFECNYAVLSL